MGTGKALVLVVDDDPDGTAYVQTALEYAGYTVLTASASDALPLVRAKQPDVILMELMMPGLRGEEVCQQLRADPATAAIPVVAMSASTSLTAIARWAGFSDRLAKPFTLQDLYATVERWAGAEVAERQGAGGQLRFRAVPRRQPAAFDD